MTNLHCRAIILSLIVIIFITISWFILLSASGGNGEIWANKQLYAGITMLFIAFCISLIPIQYIYNSSYYLLGLCIILLIIADFFGHTAMGAQRWLKFGFISIQPSEIAKIGVIMALSRRFSSMSAQQISKTKNLIIPLLITIIPVILILKQPNLGTSIIITLIAGTVFFVAGVKIWKFALVITSGLISLPIIWSFMHDYQKRRVMIFLNPEQDLLGDGYNIMQSKIAIGSGGLYGKGLLNGSQVQLSFLPEKHTDFIFTILAEEFGFYGVIAVLILYLVMLFIIYAIAISAKNIYSKLLCIGVASLIFFHLFINIGMISGLLPVVGTPLSFLSYGRSNLMTTIICIGLVLNVDLQKKKSFRV
jgi:rod shape determining protein RodA